jgi:histidinol phosphatase-like enzyme (inositol monophosphatase family)
MLITADLLADLENFADELADAAGAAIMPYFRSQISVEDKGNLQFDPVTAADKTAERVMREMILARYPEHGIIGEEESAIVSTCGLTWVLDPVDGTRAFITGLPLWGTLIALNDSRRPVIGVMNQPFTKERFIGTPRGAWCNGRQLKTRRCSGLGSATVMCTSPQMFHDPKQRAAFDSIADEARLVRYGGDCYAYCMLAAGHVDAVIEAGLQTYDVQALIPVIEGAGGVITSWDGGDAQNGGAVVACGDPALHAQLVAQLRQAV